MAKRRTIDEFIKEAKKLHGSKFDYTKVNYINTDTKVIIICPIHEKFEQTPNHHLHGGCKKCADEANGKARRKTTEEFVKEATRVHGSLYDYSKVEYKTAKTNVIIICKKHDEFSQTPGAHLRGDGCGYCRGTQIGDKNNLEYVFPKIAKEWHPTKNEKKASDYYSGDSKKKHWWLCSKEHEYDTSIINRTGPLKAGCPYCSGQRVGKDNNLEILFPDVAKQWHPSKNGNVKPSDVMGGTDKKYWWLCNKGHDYKSPPSTRTGKQKTGCPHCTNQTSKPEMRLNSELQFIFENIISRYKQDKKEIDIYLPDFKIGVEYDGRYWHIEASNKDKDINKNQFFRDKGIEIIRVREKPLEKLEKKDIIVDPHILRKKDVDSLLENLKTLVGNNERNRIDSYLKKKSFVNEKLFTRYLSYAPSPLPENSFQAFYPEVSKEWHPTLNFPLTPQNFTRGSSYKAWWICSKGHEWDATLSHRGRGNRKCAVCSGYAHNLRKNKK